jgi:hypothetical protein
LLMLDMTGESKVNLLLSVPMTVLIVTETS